MALKIILADDHKIVIEGLRNLLEKQRDMSVTGEACNGSNAIKITEDLKPDLVIMDISMPDINGLEATRAILEKNPSIKIIILSMHSDKRFVIEALKSGAVGYILKESAFTELIHAINTVMEGQIYLSPRIANFIIKDYINSMENKDESAFNLTAREREVLKLLTDGLNVKQIASNLGVSIKTVEAHRKQIMEKLDIHSLPELTKYAIREGLTEL